MVLRRVEEFVNTWFGLMQPSPLTLLREQDWQPDAPGAWCVRCGSSVGAGEGAERCANCPKHKLHFDRIVRLGAYHGDLRNWIRWTKFERWGEMGDRLGHLLGERINAVAPVPQATSIVTPVPMPWQRRLFRGIDHARVIARGCARSLGVGMFDILAKRNGPTQVTLSATERRKNLRGRLMVRRRFGGWHLDGVTVVLIDDVRTTGTTLNLAARMLRELGAKSVIAGVLAVADDQDRRIVGTSTSTS